MVGTFVGVGTRLGVEVEVQVEVGVAVDCGRVMDLGVLVGVGVAEERLIGKQPLTPDNSSVSQAAKMQRAKNGKRDLDTVVDTSNKDDTYVRKAGLIFSTIAPQADDGNYNTSGQIRLLLVPLSH
jgi:hypothetical protein